ncbi:MAG: DotU family type IV/VI secretion system protein [Acidobacteria bacterium]|nr:DotU family type IV/VI secretion system protein [Acidobacteriota bacterium]MCB9398980.1 DotU family type IV/VI secretion system protein [Acidobacteriota bacterium]
MELRDVIVDLFLFVATFRERLDQGAHPSLEEVHQEVKSIFARMDQKVLGDHVLKAKYERIRYGLVGLVDEVLVTSTWEQAPMWPVLEMELYGTKVAGNRFYEFLHELTPADKELLEASFYILTLGFRGAYAFDESKWEQTVSNLYRTLPNPLENEPFKLAPEAYHVIRKKAQRLDPLFSLGRSIIIFFATLVIILIFYQVVWSSIVKDVDQKSQKAMMAMKNDELRTSLQEEVQK